MPTCFKNNCFEESARCAYLASSTIAWRRVQDVPTLLQAQLLGGECNVGLPCCQNPSLECTVCLPCFKKQTLMESILCAYLALRTIPQRSALCAYLALRTIPQRRVPCVPTLLQEPSLREECPVCLPCFKNHPSEKSARCTYLALRTIPQRRVPCVPTLL